MTESGRVGPNLIDQIGEILIDGEWHTQAELARALNEPQWKIQKILTFLSRFGLATIDLAKGSVKMDQALMEIYAPEEAEDLYPTP